MEMLVQNATLLLALSLIPNPIDSQSTCSSEKPADGAIQKCATHSYFLSTRRLPFFEKEPGDVKVIYNNGGYYRSYGTEVYIECYMTWVPNDLTMAVIYADDSRGYVSKYVQIKEQAQATKPAQRFLVTSPNPLAKYSCTCMLTTVDKPEDVKSCWREQSSKDPLPPIRTCSVDTCYSNKEQPMCYEHAETELVYHDFPPKQLFKKNKCPQVAKKFDKNCTAFDKSPVVSDKAMFFYIDDQLVHSGSVYYVIGDETLVVSSSCNAQAMELKCQAWSWKNTTGMGNPQNRKETHIDTYHIQKDQCSSVNFNIRMADFVKEEFSIHWAVNLIGCHNLKLNPSQPKQVEFYISFVEIVETVGPSQKLECHAALQTKDVVEPSVTLSPDTCSCNLTLVACNPQVTIKRVEHRFQCDKGKLLTGKTTEATKTKMMTTTQSQTNTLLRSNESTQSLSMKTDKTEITSEMIQGEAQPTKGGLFSEMTLVLLIVGGGLACLVLLTATTGLVILVTKMNKKGGTSYRDSDRNPAGAIDISVIGKDEHVTEPAYSDFFTGAKGSAGISNIEEQAHPLNADSH